MSGTMSDNPSSCSVSSVELLLLFPPLPLLLLPLVIPPPFPPPLLSSPVPPFAAFPDAAAVDVFDVFHLSFAMYVLTVVFIFSSSVGMQGKALLSGTEEVTVVVVVVVVVAVDVVVMVVVFCCGAVVAVDDAVVVVLDCGVRSSGARLGVTDSPRTKASSARYRGTCRDMSSTVRGKFNISIYSHS